MSGPLKSFRVEFNPMIYDFDTGGYLSLRSILNFFQGTADRHSRSLGTSMDDFSREGLTWVYARFHMIIDSRPCDIDPLSVETWRSMARGMFAFREFTMKDGDDLIARATSTLALIDRVTRKPVPVPMSVMNQFAGHLGHAVEQESEALRWESTMERQATCIVRRGDCDVNGHMNNGTYVDLILESLDGEMAGRGEPLEVSIEYRAEVHAGDILLSQSYAAAGDPGLYIHRLVRQDDGRTVTMAMTRWRRK